MGKVYDAIDDSLKEYIERQQMFFVATAPMSGDGLVNLSPKGLDSLRILDDHTVAYADLTGSGIETVAHLKENSRIVVMFCSFDGAPKIVRLHGRGEVVEPSHDDFQQLRARFPQHVGLRTFIRIHCHRISDSCGWSVPLYEYLGQRNQLTAWSESNGIDAVREYQQSVNAVSLDGLPGIAPFPAAAEKKGVEREIDDDPSTADVKFLDDQLEAFNAGQVDRNDIKPLSLVVREGGEIIAGLKSVTGWDWMYVQVLWVQEGHRRKGLGSRLVERAEQVAQARGCVGSCLSSFSFQAPDFYKARGYTTFGQIDNYPDDCTMFFMSKRFSDPRPS